MEIFLGTGPSRGKTEREKKSREKRKTYKESNVIELMEGCLCRVTVNSLKRLFLMSYDPSSEEGNQRQTHNGKADWVTN